MNKGRARTNNLYVSKLNPIIAPADLAQVFPLSDEIAEFVSSARNQIKDILYGRDRRLMVVVGPCSIHDPKAALEYAGKLAELSRAIQEQLFVVMRVYFEKPRTTIGWKGLINDPDLNGSHQISKGLGIARQLLCAINALGLPVATELLDPITPQYLSDLISWGAIGARTTESQTHRELASGSSFPVGFKNGTDGNLQVAIDGMAAALHSHTFLGINREGRTSIVGTTGNPDVHLVLRGGNDKPNYHPDDIAKAVGMLTKAGLGRGLMVDCSHANSFKDHERQEEVLIDVMEQIGAGEKSIAALMIESCLKPGSQKISGNSADLEYGVSITDKCVGWEATERMLRYAAKKLREMGGRPL
ncbi:MAG: 3-deoxy-7-phosphoheptulonate synthase [Desulfuromonadaceae bacterium]|nr:3-deoxy-7-phosphoheptulonate synthase [Desulfuromonadaceae bacterium]